MNQPCMTQMHEDIWGVPHHQIQCPDQNGKGQKIEFGGYTQPTKRSFVKLIIANILFGLILCARHHWLQTSQTILSRNGYILCEAQCKMKIGICFVNNHYEFQISNNRALNQVWALLRMGPFSIAQVAGPDSFWSWQRSSEAGTVTHSIF